jgi:hypothetical protein
MAVAPRLHVARSAARLADGKVYHYAYLRYEVWDEKKRRHQPKPLASLGRTDRLDEERVESLGGFLREWLRKDSSLPFDALRERFQSLESTFQILCSRDFGLRFLVEQAWVELGYGEVVEELAREVGGEGRVDLAIFSMVLVQLLAPQSKRGMAEWNGMEVFFPEGECLGLQDLYSAMDVLEAGYDVVAKKLNSRLRELGAGPTELAVDTTTLACSVRYDDVERAAIEQDRQARGLAERSAVVNEPPLRMRGRSKSKRHDLPQVVLEAVVGDNGLIVHHDLHSGNTNDARLMPETLKAVSGLGYRGVRWSADAGMNSVTNRRALRDTDFEFVLGEGVSRTSTVKKVLATPGRYQQHPERPELSYKCVVAVAEEESTKARPGPERLYIIRRNRDEEAHGRRRIQRHVQAVEKIIAKGGSERQKLPFHKTYRRYVRRDGRKKDARGRAAGAVILDRKAIARMKALAGKSVIATDYCDAHPVVEDDVYRNLFEAEAVFRRLKSTIGIGPIRHRRADRIRAHVMIGVMALNLGRWLELRSGMTIDRLRRLFANLRVQQVRMGESEFWERTNLETRQRAVFTKLGYDVPPKRFTVSVAESAFAEHQVADG